MRTATLLATTASLLGVASARIVGFAAPSTVAPDSDVRLQILTEDYIQSVQDVAFSFGISPSDASYPNSLGQLLSSKFLGQDDSNIVGNITHIVHIPSSVSASQGQYSLSGAHFSLTGAVLSPSVENYAVNVTIGNFTSNDYVTSTLL